MMTEKTIQKTQTDLVQAVLDAQEKRNSERVDMLVTNAIKQLKMSRFKPDQTTCISLTYLARINPKIFIQSSAIKEVLKSLLRRDNGPANIKGKNDIVLPVLAANILLACCDANEVRGIIIHKIEQWVSSNQKASEMIQHLMATLCTKCQGDQQTISSLVELRHHWLQYLGDNFETYKSVPPDLCSNIRRLIHTETSCESLVIYLEFLIKHDSDIDLMAKEVSKLIIERPISLGGLVKDGETGPQLIKIIFKTFSKIFIYLKDTSIDQQMPSKQHKLNVEDKKSDVDIKSESKIETTGISMKPEPEERDQKPLLDPKREVKGEEKPSEASPSLTPQSTAYRPNKPVPDENLESRQFCKTLYFKVQNNSQVIKLGRSILEAVLSLLAMVEMNEEYHNEFEELLNCWVLGMKSDKFATIYEDAALTSVYNLSDKVRQKLLLSQNDQLIDLGLHGVTVAQLVTLVQQYGLSLATLNKMFRKLGSMKDLDAIRSEIKDISYFYQLLEFYTLMGASGAKDLQRRLSSTSE